MSDLRERIDAVLADAADAIDRGDDETLAAVAAAADGLVEGNDSSALLAAVGLADAGDEDASIPDALATGDSDRVLELERLLKLSRFAGEDGEDHRADLLDLFDAGGGEGSGDPDESDDGNADGGDGSEDDGSMRESVQSAAEAVSDAVTDSDEDGESAADGVDVSVPDVGPLDDGADESGGDGTANAETGGADTDDSGGVEAELRERLREGLSSFREGIERAQGDLDAFASSADDRVEEATDDRQSGTGRGRSGRHSTVPGRKRASLRHSTVTGRSHLSTMPDRDDD